MFQQTKHAMEVFQWIIRITIRIIIVFVILFRRIAVVGNNLPELSHKRICVLF